MSYNTMDHAGWVERKASAAKSMMKRRPSPAATKGWGAAPETLSGFQAKVMDILGMVGSGIYNAPIAWNGVQWKGWGGGIAVPWRHDLSTFDFANLTRLVFLGHEARIRVEIRPHAPGHLLLCFWPRTDTGRSSQRHPNLDEAVAEFRKYLPADHRILYRAPAPAAEAAE